MKGKTARFIAVASAVLALSLAMTASAFASVHVTSWMAASPTLSASLVSTGDAGWNHGNQNNTMSPILPSPADGFRGWFNQNVTFSNLVITDPEFDGDVILGDPFWQFSTDGSSWTPNTPFVDSMAVSAEGLYGLNAAGTDDTETADVANGSVVPAFGIDKTRPASTSDAVPYYSATALVTITATDTLSGVENLQTSVDGGPWDWANDADPGSLFAVPVAFGPGTHTLSWHVFDNADNIDSHSVSFTVRPVGFIPNVSLTAKPLKGNSRERPNAKFSGSVSPLASNTTLKLTVQRYNKKTKKWSNYSAFTITVPKYAGSCSLTKFFKSDGQYRALASFGGGSSSLKAFLIN